LIKHVASDRMRTLWYFLQHVCLIAVPIYPETIHFGPRGWGEIVASLLAMTGLCCTVGFWLTRSPVLLRFVAKYNAELRDEAWDELRPPVAEQSAEASVEEARRPPIKKRTSSELLFITVHNGSVTVLAAIAWILGQPTLALYAFCLEVAYEIFDTISLGSQRMEPETLIHHIVSPICILCSTQTKVDFRVLCHLCICIDLSGAILGYSKFLLRYAHVSSSLVYRRLTWVYFALRVVGPLIDTAIIVTTEVKTRGTLFGLGVYNDHDKFFARTDWTQLYFWAMAVLNTFNFYFFMVIRARARMPPQMCANMERMGCS